MFTKRNNIFSTIILFLLGSTMLFAQTEQQNSDVMSTIQQKYQEFGQYMQSGDTDGLVANLYTDDATIYPPNGGVVSTSKGISKFVSGMLSSGMVIQLVPKEVEMLGDAIYDYGVANVSNMEGEKLGIQRYMVIWKKVDGEWRIY
ncbi:YybH family protein [Gracilimonas sediminicola]|uniref:YybH family protein n=1 Tax=Gracilimonas sediminicola TaxID=2952158 RepID=UPI0038D3C709